MLRMLMRADVAEQIGRAYKIGNAPTAMQLEAFKAARAARPKLAEKLPGARPSAASEPENYAVVGNVAQICIEGVLSEEPDFWAWLFGMDGTTYEDIRDAFALAASDPMVQSVVLDVGSPGGYLDGMFETLAVIEAFGKPIRVQASEACSAAYALAAMAGPITAKSPAACFGSIGVACDYCFSTDEEIVSVTSSDAPNKRPDPRTADGKAVIVDYLDDLHELFVDAIARGRTAATGKEYTVEQVNTEFGRGAMVLADAARSVGMIDKMPRAPKRGYSASADANPEFGDGVTDSRTPSQVLAGYDELVATGMITRHRALNAAKPNGTKPSATFEAGAPNKDKPRATGPTRKTDMDLNTLKIEHPALYAAVLAEGETSGQAKERKRVNAHLKMGKSHHAMDVAEKAIASGASLSDEEVLADYLSAGKNHDSQTARQSDSDAAGKALEGSAPKTEALDNGDLVARAMGLPSPKKVA